MADQMITIKEGRMNFLFNTGYQKAKKYDEWEFYRLYFGKIPNTKAVDIICIDNRLNNTFLVEIKDYTNHHRVKEQPIHEEIAQKIRDSIAGLYLASISTNTSFEDEVLFAQEALSKPIRIVFHCEVPKSKIDWLADIRMKLRKLFRTIDRNLIVGYEVDCFAWAVKKGIIK